MIYDKQNLQQIVYMLIIIENTFIINNKEIDYVFFRVWEAILWRKKR